MLSGRRKLLLADDSPTIQKVISLTFGDEGVEVVAVGDGESALRALEEEPPPDVLLADVVMPGPDGYELCERVKRDGRLRHIPVVLLVGTFEPFNEAEARRVGADIVLTKPFQSIRGLVSKVGSLFGGGEPHQEDEAAQARDESAPRGATDPGRHAAARADSRAPEEARRDASPDADGHGAEPSSSSFADFGADDELIEARPADAFGAAAGAAGFPPRAGAPSAFAETHEPGFQAASWPEAGGGVAPAHAAFGAPSADAEPFTLRDEVGETNQLEDGLAVRAEDGQMDEIIPSQSSFDARAAGSAAADDVLLDLGRLDTPATASAAEADDFILDLDLDDEPRPQYADAPSAFAEAAHGEQPLHFAEASAAEVASPFGDSTHDGQTHEAQFQSFREEPPHAEEPLRAEEAESTASAEPWRDVVVQDGPQGFAFGAEARSTGAAPRGFIEPEVVPADEPVPAVFEGEFTDGSVEGDTPKAPTPEMTGAGAAAWQEPSAAGHAVGEAHAGLEESPRAGQLSPEDVDAIARRVVELMSDKAVREIAWEVVPELAELVIRQRLSEEKQSQ